MNKSGLLGASRLIEYMSILLVAWGLVLCASAAVAQSVFDLNSASGAAAIQYDEDGLVLRKTLLQSQTIGAAYLTADYWNVLDASGAIACSVDLSSGASAGTMRIKGTFSPSQTLSPAAGDLWQLKNGNGNYVLILDSGGNLKISGILSENATWTTQYNQFSFGIPVDTPENGVVAQVLRGSGATAKSLQIAAVEKVTNGIHTPVPEDSFALQPMTEGNYNLVWTNSGDIDLSATDSVEITLNRNETSGEVPDHTIDIPIQTPGTDTIWAPTNLYAFNDVWQLTVSNYVLSASEGAGSSCLFPFHRSNTYPITVQKTAELPHDPPPVAYGGWSAFYPYVGAVDNTQWAAGNGVLVNDPSGIVGKPLSGLHEGGTATLAFYDLKMYEASGFDRLLLTRIASSDPSVEKHRKLVTLDFPGLNNLKASGLSNSVAQLVISQSDQSGPLDGKIRVYNANDPEHPVLAMDETQNQALISLEAFQNNERWTLLVEGSVEGHGFLTASLRFTSQPSGTVVNSTALSYYVIEPFTVSISEGARTVNEKRIRITMEPDLEPSEDMTDAVALKWSTDRNLVLFHDCGFPTQGTTKLELIENQPSILPVLFSYDENFGQRRIGLSKGGLLSPIVTSINSSLTYDEDTYYDTTPDYIVYLGMDIDQDGELGPDERLGVFGLHLATQQNLDSATASINDLRTGFPPNFTDLSYALFTNFNTGSWSSVPVEYLPNVIDNTSVRGSENANSSLTRNRLTHNFGSSSSSGRWANLLLDTPRYFYSDASAASSIIENDFDSDLSIVHYIETEISYGQIASRYTGPGPEVLDFENQAIPVNIGDYDSIFVVGTGNFSMYGTLSLSVESSGGSFIVREASGSFVAKDLFDFNYFSQILWGLAPGPKAGATVQSSFNQCGNSTGKVFVTEIEVNKNLYSVYIQINP